MNILELDIETFPNTAHVWGLFNENIPLARLVKPGYTLCWAAKWYGKDEILFSSIKKHGVVGMMGRLWDLLDKADVVVHYNGKKFDIPTINREFVVYDFLPPSPYKQVDLLRVVKRNFKFPSNKLAYVAKALGIQEKLETIGYDLWLECEAGKPSAWKQMEEYNKQDVVVLEDLYDVLKPWIHNHPNHSSHTGTMCCPSCGGTHLQKRGYSYTATLNYQRYQCMDCGGWSRERLTFNKLATAKMVQEGL